MRRKYLIIIGIVASLYGVVINTNATDYTKVTDNKLINYPSDNWEDSLTIVSTDAVLNQIVDKSSDAIVNNMVAELNVREEPSLNSTIINKLSAGTPVKVLEVSGGWARLEVPSGYVSEIYLQYSGRIDVFEQ